MLWDTGTGAGATGVRDDWPLCGRAPELARVREAYEGATDGGALLVGPDGCGRTRLAREAQQALVALRAPTAWVAATRAARSIPFGALAQLFPSSAAWSGPPSLAAAKDAVGRLAGDGERRLVLVVDDAHLLDEASAALLLQLVLDQTAFVLATFPPGARPPDPVLTLWKDKLAIRLDLEPLGEHTLITLLETRLRGPVDGGTRHRLVEDTGGNPLLLRELVEHALATGALNRQHGVWRAVCELEPGDRLTELVQSRLDTLDRDERRALELVALSDGLDLHAFEQLCGAEAAAGLERGQLVTVRREGRRRTIVVRPPLLARVVREAVPAVVAAACCRALADHHGSRGARRQSDARALGVLALAGEAEPAPELLLRAASDASRRGRPDLAERLAHAALDARPGLPAATALGTALTAAGRWDEAESVLAPYEGALPGATAAQAGAYLLWRSMALQRAGHDGEALALLERARRRRTDRAFHAHVEAALAHLHNAIGHSDEVARHAAAAQEGGDAAAARLAARAGAVAQILTGRPALAVQVRAAALDPTAAWAPVPPRAAALALAGRLREAEAHVSRAYERAVQAGDEEALAEVCVVRGWVTMLQGTVTTARRWLVEAAVRLRVSDPAGLLPWCLTVEAMAAAQSGASPDARRLVAEARALPGAPPSLLDLGEAWVLASEGESSRAQELALRAADAERRRPLLRALALHDALRLGCPASRIAPGLAELAAGGDSDLVQAFALHAAASRGGSRALEAAAQLFEDLGLAVHAAEALGAAAQALRQEGREGAARRLASRAQALLAPCDRVRTPGLRAADATPSGLTGREREVAELAARGLANSTIAERLVVSVRTVESHLYSAFSKLGIERREDLASLLEPQRMAAGA